LRQQIDANGLALEVVVVGVLVLHVRLTPKKEKVKHSKKKKKTTMKLQHTVSFQVFTRGSFSRI
jgi:hypothetical protein